MKGSAFAQQRKCACQLLSTIMPVVCTYMLTPYGVCRSWIASANGIFPGSCRGPDLAWCLSALWARHPAASHSACWQS